jgi:hypothetical protein
MEHDWKQCDVCGRAMYYSGGTTTCGLGPCLAVERGEFALANDPPKYRRASFTNGDKRRQRVCVEGMDLCAGQLDLF